MTSSASVSSEDTTSGSCRVLSRSTSSRSSLVQPELTHYPDKDSDTINRSDSVEDLDVYLNGLMSDTATGNDGDDLQSRLTYRRSSQPVESTADDDNDEFCEGNLKRSDSAESFNAYKKKHERLDSFKAYKSRRPRLDNHNATFNPRFSLRRRRPSELRGNNLRHTVGHALDGSRDSFELKQATLYAMQFDGTLEELSNLEHLRLAEEWTTKQNFWRRLAIRASSPDIGQKELIQRSTFLIISAMTVGAGVIWGIMYVILGEWLAALMPFIYSSSMGLIMSTCICYAKNKYDIFVNCQLTLILLLPMSVHWALGGMEASGGVILWSFLCPMGAAFFRSADESLKWFYLYTGLSAGLLLFDHWKSRDIDGGSNVITAMYFAMNVLGVKGVIFAVVFVFARELEKEYAKSEEVLSNILPPAIVTRIKHGEFPIVDHVAGVSILFADLVGFTKASTELHPNFLIGLFLRDVFHSFDELVDKHGLEKIKTIGDAYMVVGGLNHCSAPSKDKHLKQQHHTFRTMMLATDMFDELEKINKKYSLSFDLRIGVHSGPVVAGVLGLKRFTYDVWGDSVNVSAHFFCK
ncbi:hypothetical protein HJC23_003497 [Cyclotella cryptica]|uniref:Guanylate cyclase domain-containing protein n=1 Tax=Cyclotella cryptica TaxID=29204 RepID=A0ABD3QSL4_9STRA